MNKNYLTYPCKYMNISQTYDGTFSHYECSHGTPADYPIDDCGKDIGRDYLYCPCDEIEILRIYGVNTSGTNTIWLRSTSPVYFANGESDYVVMMVIHPEDDDLSMLKVGQKFTRGQSMFREGKDGKATGNHFHISFGKGQITGNGWSQNSSKEWVLTTSKGTIKPELACYVDSTFTQIVNANGLNFTKLQEDSDMLYGTDDNEPVITNMIGIDVSVHNGVVDWDKVKASGIKFVMIRAGFGSAPSQVDKRWQVNVEGAIDVGLDVGAYWFSYARNINEVKQEAELFNRVLEPYRGKLTMPVVYDFEYDSVNYAKKNGVNITKEIATEFAITFCEEMEKYGWYAMNYTNLDYYVNYFDSNKMKFIDTWYANWSVKTPDIDCGMWQYSAKGKVDGLANDTDMNICYKDYPTLIKEQGYNGFTKPEVEVKEDNTDLKEKYDDLLKEYNKLNNTNVELSANVYSLQEENAKLKTLYSYCKKFVDDIGDIVKSL